MKGAIHVGTSGWTYESWKQRFYPNSVKSAERLSYYAEHFDTVEVNATFYRFPSPVMTRAWNQRLDSDFHLVVKAHRLITHRKRLSDCDTQVADFLGRLSELHALRAVLWQLPPTLSLDLPRLDHFLAELPDTELRHAVEFRHPSWWHPEVGACLRSHAAAFVAVSHPTLPPEVVATTDFLYLRFHGLGSDPHRHAYTRADLEEWAQRLRPHLEGRTLYAFFNNDFEAHAIRDARAFLEILAA